MNLNLKLLFLPAQDPSDLNSSLVIGQRVIPLISGTSFLELFSLNFGFTKTKHVYYPPLWFDVLCVYKYLLIVEENIKV